MQRGFLILEEFSVTRIHRYAGTLKHGKRMLKEGKRHVKGWLGQYTTSMECTHMHAVTMQGCCHMLLIYMYTHHMERVIPSNTDTVYRHNVHVCLCTTLHTRTLITVHTLYMYMYMSLYEKASHATLPWVTRHKLSSCDHTHTRPMWGDWGHIMGKLTCVSNSSPQVTAIQCWPQLMITIL